MIIAALVVSAALLGRPAGVDGAAPLTTKPYSTYVSQAHPVMHQWWVGIESWQNRHFLTEPLATNTESASEVNELLRQWWFGLENARGHHFLIEPFGGNTDSTAELHSILNSWQNAVEGWRGLHFMLEPPGPFQAFTIKRVGAFELKPKDADPRPGESVDYEVEWTVPRPNNWHDLKTIDLRACGKGGVLWVRWEELTDTVRLLDPSNGRTLGKGRLGATRRLGSPTAKLSLAKSSVEAKGETDRRMTLVLALTFKREAAGSDCKLDLAARDDLGNRDSFKRAGRVAIGA